MYVLTAFRHGRLTCNQHLRDTGVLLNAAVLKTLLKHLTRLSIQLANACLEHQGVAFHCSNIKLGFKIPNKR